MRDKMKDSVRDNMRDKIKRNSFGRAIKADNQSEKI
jgi:hypothetical protein